MILIFTIIISVISAAIFDLLPIMKVIKQLLIDQKKALETIKNKQLNDAQKQKSLFLISGSIFYASIKLIILLVIVAIPFMAFVFLGNLISGSVHYSEYLISFEGILITTGCFILYFLVKKAL